MEAPQGRTADSPQNATAPAANRSRQLRLPFHSALLGEAPDTAAATAYSRRRRSRPLSVDKQLLTKGSAPNSTRPVVHRVGEGRPANRDVASPPESVSRSKTRAAEDGKCVRRREACSTGTRCREDRSRRYRGRRIDLPGNGLVAEASPTERRHAMTY